MSKVFVALSEGRATEFKARVNGAECWVVALDGKFYTRSIRAQRYFRVAADKIKPFHPAPEQLH